MQSVWMAALAICMTMGSLALGALPSLANGGKSKRVVYQGTLRAGDGADRNVHFDAEIEPLLLRLTGVGDRYRVIRIRIRNTGTRPLILSASADTVEAHMRIGPPVKGVLDLGAHDAAVWDGLAADLRNAIVYPRSVPGGEEESIFVFLPAADFADVPQGFRYLIASRPDHPVVMRDASAAVAR